MEERKSNLLSRFWPPSASRRKTTTQTAATTTPTSSTKRTTQAETRQSTAKSGSPPPRATQPQKADQKTRQQTDSKDKSKTSSPSSSPSRLSAQVQPSPPSRASKPHSPSPSPKKGSSNSPSPSKGLTQQQQQPSVLFSTEKDPKLAPPQQAQHMEEEVKHDSPKVVNGPTQDNVEANQSQLSQLGSATTPGEANKSLDSDIVNGGHEALFESEIKDVKEVAQATKDEVDEEKKKEVIAPKPVSEADMVQTEQIQREKQQALHTKEVLETPANGKASQPTTRNTGSAAHDNKSSLPNGKQQENIKADKSEFANKMAIRDPRNAISDRHVSVITLAGENRGASMQMESDSSKREGPIHINRGYKLNPDQSPEATTDGEESSEEKKPGDERAMEDQLTEAYVNNNAQGINNSIVFNSSIVEGNPGVHMVVSHLPKEPIQSKDKTETRKAEVNTSRSEKLTYQPTVRRRCLKGLLMESSDSDPEKPRRHGCRVDCQKGHSQNNIDVL